MKRVVLFIGVLVAMLLLLLIFLTFTRDKKTGIIGVSTRFYNQHIIGQDNVTFGLFEQLHN